MRENAFSLYEEGNIGHALELLREMREDSAARSLVALTENRPADVLGDPLEASDAQVLYLRAIAAWRVGDVLQLQDAVKRLFEVTADGEEYDELATFLCVGQSADGGRMRVKMDGEPAAASFDPTHSHVVADVKVNGRVLKFLIDTGAEMTAINSVAAAELEVRQPTSETVIAGSNAGAVEMGVGMIGQVSFLGSLWREVPTLTVDLSHLKSRLGIDGILGVQDLLSEDALRIDYQRGEITRSIRSSEDGWPLYFTQGRSLISVEGRMDGGPTGLFRIDTGGARSVLTKEYLAAALDLGAAWAVSETRKETCRIVNESVRQRRYVEQLCFRPSGSPGSLALANVRVDTTMADDLIAYAGKLGADAFKGRVLELDYPACRMRLTPPD